MKATEPILNLEGEVAATSGGLVTRVNASGDRLIWNVDDLAAFRRAVPATDRRGIARLANTIERLGLTLELVADGRTALLVGNVRPSVLSRVFFGTPHLRARPTVWLRALWV